MSELGREHSLANTCQRISRQENAVEGQGIVLGICRANVNRDGQLTCCAAFSSPAKAAILFWAGHRVDHKALHVGDRRPRAVLMDSAECTGVSANSCRQTLVQTHRKRKRIWPYSFGQLTGWTTGPYIWATGAPEQC